MLTDTALKRTSDQTPVQVAVAYIRTATLFGFVCTRYEIMFIRLRKQSINTLSICDRLSRGLLSTALDLLTSSTRSNTFRHLNVCHVKLLASRCFRLNLGLLYVSSNCISPMAEGNLFYPHISQKCKLSFLVWS